MLITDAKEREKRAATKRHLLLRFLRDELYTTPTVAGLVIGCGTRATRQTVAQMEAAGLVKRHQVALAEGLPLVVVIGITGHGQGVAFDIETENVRAREFRPCDWSPLHLQHTVDLQKLRVSSANLCAKWVPGGLLPASKKGVKRPDAIAVLRDGVRVAIEVERTIKNPMRYREILTGHLIAQRQKSWQRVVWASPSSDISSRIQRLLTSITRLKINGIDTILDPSHFANLAFCTYENFPAALTKEQQA